MNKVITINLAGRAYQLEEHGFQILKNYLEEAEAKLADNPDKTEIMVDFEQAIAEKCDKHLNANKTVIAKTEIEQIIKEMGPVETQSDGQKTESKTSASTKKKLYRDPDNVMIAGVAAGLAAYFGIEVTLMRIILAVTILFWGGGIVLYILLWILIPQAENTSEKFEMRGDKVTLSNLEETIKEKLNDPGSKLANFISKFFALIIRLVHALFKFALGIAGFFVTLGATIAAFFATMLAVIFLFNRHSPYIDPAVNDIFTGNLYYLALAAAYLTVILPVVAMILVGVSILRRKNIVNAIAITSIVGIWFIAAPVLGALITHAAPRIEAAANATYPTVSRELNLKDFEDVSASGDYNVNITQGDSYKVTLTGEEKYLDDADIQVYNLKNLVAEKHNKFRICLFCFHKNLTLDITMPDLKNLSGHGAVNIQAQHFNLDSLHIGLTGASDVNLDLAVKNLTTQISGASDLTISGTADNMSARLSGASNLEAKDFKIKSAIVTASGSSDTYLNVTENLEVKASGASNVYYSGDPILKIDTSGSSDVEKF